MENKIIMLVEDNPDDVYLTLRAFKKNNINNKVIVAKNAREALDYLFAEGMYADRNLRDLPAVILLDLNLPEIKGIEVLKAIRQNEITKLLPVVVLSSSTEEQDMADSYKLGANSFIHKPIDFNEFMEAVKILILYWLAWNEQPPGGR